MAVWDVDYACDTGPCERDAMYLNGQQLGYLTGANDQWSTVSFPVSASGIVEGDNIVHIDIDTLDGGWCVECDWAELTLETTVPEIDDIEITPEWQLVNA
jgi:hypothetical protein